MNIHVILVARRVVAIFPEVSHFKKKGKRSRPLILNLRHARCVLDHRVSIFPRRYITQPLRRSLPIVVLFISCFRVETTSALFAIYPSRIHRWIQITENNSSIKMHKELVSSLSSARTRVHRLRGQRVGEYKIVGREKEIEEKDEEEEQEDGNGKQDNKTAVSSIPGKLILPFVSR